MTKLQSYILDNYTRIGDKVIMQMDPEIRCWLSGKQIPDGTIGTVVGYYRYTMYRERNHGMFGVKSGKYEGNGAVIVAWENGESGTTSAHYICPIDQTVLKSRKKDEQYKQAFDTDCFIEDLPETPFYEGDILQLKNDFFNDGGKVKVLSIDYYNLDKFCNDGVTPYPCYRVESVHGRSGQISTRADEVLEIVKRGNIYNYYHSLPFDFDDIKDEISFYRQIGKTQQVRNPRTGNYSWSLEDIVEGIEQKQIAYMMMSGSLFGSTSFPTAYVIPEYPKLEERARQEFRINEFKEMLHDQ